MSKFQTYWYGLSAAAAVGLAALTFGAAHAQQAAGASRFEGTLSVVWGDPRPGQRGGATRFSLTTADGIKHQLQLSAAQQNAAVTYFGKRVAVQGQPTNGANSASAAPSLTVNQIESIEPAELAPAPALRTKTRRVLYILLKFQGDAQEPHPPSFFDALTNPKRPPAGSNAVTTLNGFYDKTSWGQLRWRGDVIGAGGLNPTHWLTLPKTKAQYAPCGWQDVCADLDGIQADGIALAQNAGVDISIYDNINFVLNNDLDCCAWGGGFFYNGKSYGATWEPPWGQEAGTYVHEFGHSLGLPHSGWVYYAYDSPWDEMSSGSAAQYVQCATYMSANDNGANDPVYCTEPGAGYIVAHKDVLRWIPTENQVVIKKAKTKTVTLEDNALPLGTGIKMIKVCLAGESCKGADAHYLTIEARASNKAYERGVPGEGVIIHDFKANRGEIGTNDPCFFNTQSGWAVPIDATPGDYRGAPNCDTGGRSWPNYGLGNAEFLPGDIYSNSALHVTIRVVKKSKSNYIVRVTRSQ